MIQRIIIAGSGGQGIMLLGKILAEAAMYENKFVTWLPAYGAEVRGGAAHCSVVISDQEISSPLIESADILIAMNEPSAEKFKAKLKKSGLFIVNSSLAGRHDFKGHLCPAAFTEIASKLGNPRVANMVALGVLIARANIVNPKTVIKVMENIAPADKKELVKINIRALEEGMGIK